MLSPWISSYSSSPASNTSRYQPLVWELNLIVVGLIEPLARLRGEIRDISADKGTGGVPTGPASGYQG